MNGAIRQGCIPFSGSTVVSKICKRSNQIAAKCFGILTVIELDYVFLAVKTNEVCKIMCPVYLLASSGSVKLFAHVEPTPKLLLMGKQLFFEINLGNCLSHSAVCNMEHEQRLAPLDKHNLKLLL